MVGAGITSDKGCSQQLASAVELVFQMHAVQQILIMRVIVE